MGEMKRIEVKTKKLISFGCSWNIDNSIGNIIIVTDILDTSTRYNELAQYLNDKKFDVYCIDLFGQGENVLLDSSNLGIVPESAFRKQVQIIDALVKQLRVSARPTFILSLGYGAIISQDYIQRYTEHVSKVVLAGCPYAPCAPLKFFFAKIAKLFIQRNKLSKKYHNDFYLKFCNKNYLDWLSDDPTSIEEYSKNPLCGFNPSFGFYFELLKGMNRLYKKKFMNKIRKDLDILLISSSFDPITKNGKDTLKIANIYRKLKIKNVEVINIDVKVHDIFHCSQKEQTFEIVANFFLEDIEHKNVV